MKLCIDEFFLEDQKRFAETVIDDETFKDILEFLDLACGDCSGKICKFVGFVKDIGGNLIDGKVGDLVAEEWIELGNVLEDGDDLGHEGTYVLVVLVEGLGVEVLDVGDGDGMVVEEGCLEGSCVWIWGGRAQACSLYEFSDPDTAVGIKHSGEAVVPVVALPACRCEHTGDLGKDTDRVDSTEICDDIAVGVLVSEQKGAEIGLAVLHHVPDGSDDGWIAHDDSLVEARKQGAAGYWQRQELWVELGHRLPGYGPRVWRSRGLALLATVAAVVWLLVRVVVVVGLVVVGLVVLVVLRVHPSRRKQRGSVPQKMDLCCREMPGWNAHKTAQHSTHRRPTFFLRNIK